jgi:hypothetical protein
LLVASTVDIVAKVNKIYNYMRVDNVSNVDNTGKLLGKNAQQGVLSFPVSRRNRYERQHR